LKDSLERLKQRITDTFGTRNVRFLYRAGSLATLAKGIAKYNFDLLRV
jgi:hypothetical protein